MGIVKEIFTELYEDARANGLSVDDSVIVAHARFDETLIDLASFVRTQTEEKHE